MKYAIFGAAGAVGKELAKILAREQAPFRVVGRSENELRKSFGKYGPQVEYCIADLTQPEDAARAAAGIDTVFYLVGVPYTDFGLHPIMSRISVEAAAQAGVRRFVHLSTIYPYGRRQAEQVNEDHPREPHTYKGRMRKKQEDIVLAAHGSNGMQVAILCPPDFYGGDSPLSHMHRAFTGAIEGKPADMIGPIDIPHEFIYVPDLADTLYKLSRREAAFGKRWNLGGAGRITMREFAAGIYSARERKLRVRAMGKTLLRLAGMFNPVLREMVEMNYLMSEPLFIDDSRLTALIPDLRKTSYSEGIQATLAAMDAKRKQEEGAPGR